MNIVDRRLNPKGKSLGNRQRFLTRARAEVKGAVQEATRRRKVGDLEGAEKISIPAKGIVEPNFRYARGTGKREMIVPGNKEFIAGDKIPRPPGGEGGGGRGEASPDGEGGSVEASEPNLRLGSGPITSTSLPPCAISE